MPNILFFTQPHTGHYNVMRSSARLLKERNNRVAVVSVESLRKEVEKDSLEFIPFKKDYLMKRHNGVQGFRSWINAQGTSFSGVVRTADETCACDVEAKLNDLGDLMTTFKPDACVCDIFSIEGFIFSEMNNIPYATFCWGIVPTDHKKLPPWGPPGLKVPENKLDFLYCHYIRMKNNLPWSKVDRRINKVRISHNLKKGKNLMQHLSPYLVIGPCIEPFGYPLSFYQKQVHYVGATTFDGNVNGWGDFPKDKLDYTKPRIYMSFGTVMNSDAKLINDIMKQLYHENVQLIVATGGGIDLTKIEKYPESWIVKTYVPQKILMKEIDLLITHGGSNTVMDSCVEGVPMITYPMGADQFNNVRRVEELNTGIRLHSKDIEKRLVKDKVMKVLNTPVYKQNAQRLKELYSGYDGNKISADLIEKLAIEKKPILR